MSKLYQSKKWLTLQYVRLDKSPKEIADMCGVTQANIYLYIKKFGIKK